MKVLLIGTSVDYKHKERGNLGGFNHAFSAAFKSMGHDVHSYSHSEIRTAARLPGNFDLFLLRDVTVDTKAVAQLAGRSDKFAVFTHAEFVQAKVMDVQFFDRMAKFNTMPDYLFYDQPLAYQRYEELGITIPGTFLGWGANPAAYMAEEKDIDIAWFGHAYGERQGRVESLIFPLKDRYWLNVRIHGRNQPDGPVGMLEMFDIMARTKVVVRISHKAHHEGGYSGRTIYDAMASGCIVLHDEYPMCTKMFPDETAVFFSTINNFREFLREPMASQDIGGPINNSWVREHRMVTHVAQQMIEFAFEERPHELFCPY